MRLSKILEASALAVPLAACGAATNGGYYEPLPGTTVYERPAPRTRYIPAPVYQDDIYDSDEDTASPLPSESQLQGAGCGIVDRNFQRGTLTYECPVNTRFYVGNPGAGAGVRCTPMGRAFNGAVYTERYQCRENMPDFDADYGQRLYGYPDNDWNGYPRRDRTWDRPRTDDRPFLRPHAPTDGGPQRPPHGQVTPPPVLVTPPDNRQPPHPPRVTPPQRPMADGVVTDEWKRKHNIDPRRFPPADGYAPKPQQP